MLGGLHKTFERKIAILSDRASRLQSEAPSIDPVRVRYLTEGIISDLWQSWTNFCRTIILESCLGSKSRSGQLIPPRMGDNSWQRIGYEAFCAVRGRSIHASKVNQFMRQEPTWGDVGRLITLIQVVRPVNSAMLLTAFGLPLLGPVHLQRTRNACFHKNADTLGDVRSLFIHYRIMNFSSPCDLAWQLDPTKSTLAIYAWMDDLEVMVDKATQ